MGGKIMLVIKELSKKIGNKQILNNINLKIPKGSIYGIIGKNGAGKTGVLQLNNINFFETLDIALFFCQFFCIFYSYFLVLCDIIVSGGVSYG